MTVRNQSVLLNGVNNTVEAMGELMHALGDLNIEPVSRRKLSQPFVARVPKANSRSKVLRSPSLYGGTSGRRARQCMCKTD